MKSYACNLHRAGILSRTIAYLIDALIIGAGIVLLIVPTMLFLMAIGVPFDSNTNGTNYDVQMPGDTVTGWIVAVMILILLTYFVTAFSYVICYTILLEGYFGRTVAKYLMGLKVLREDGPRSASGLVNVLIYLITPLLRPAAHAALFRSRNSSRPIKLQGRSWCIPVEVIEVSEVSEFYLF